ncbi:hypothetical protein KC799_20580 [candidate division KSB1 bacterium]|nr:hypothetical protein [candidate division KSB1 bacterium]
MQKFPSVPLILVPMLFLLSCSENEKPNPQEAATLEKVSIQPAKWFNNKSAAVSLTYDAAWGTHPQDPEYQQMLEKVANEIIDRDLRMDFELSSWIYVRDDYKQWLMSMRDELYPNGIHFFGHGHLHHNYDEKSYQAAYALFKQCYDLMQTWDLHPKAYGYPYGKCAKASTRKANRDAGWICARSIEQKQDQLYICPNDISEPNDWYALPALPIASTVDQYFQNNAEILPVMQKAMEKKAWLIFMYHNIGLTNYNGWYAWDEFIKDLDMLQELDVWVGNMDEVASYIQARNAFKYTITPLDTTSGTRQYMVAIDKDFQNKFKDVTLTLEIIMESDQVMRTAQFVSSETENDDAYPVINNSFMINIPLNRNQFILNIDQRNKS